MTAEQARKTSFENIDCKDWYEEAIEKIKAAALRGEFQVSHYINLDSVEARESTTDAPKQRVINRHLGAVKLLKSLGYKVEFPRSGYGFGLEYEVVISWK